MNKNSLRMVEKAGGYWAQAAVTLNDEDRLYLQFTNTPLLDTLDKVLEDVQIKRKSCLERRWRFKKRNGEVVILRDVLDKVMVWVNKFKEIGDIVIQYDPMYTSLPWAGIRFLLQLSINDSQIFGAMMEGVEHVSNLIPRYVIFELLYLQHDVAAGAAVHGQLQKALVKLYATVLQYLAKASRYYRQSTIGRIGSSAFHTSESTVDAYLKKISSEQAEVDRCAELVDAEYRHHISDSVQDIRNDLLDLKIEYQNTGDILQQLRSYLHELSEPVPRMAVQLCELHDSLKKSERKEIVHWLSTVPHRTHHNAAGKNFLPGTGVWLQRKAEFTEWRKSSGSSILWLRGIPGSGKSKLVYSVIEALNRDRSPNNRLAPTAYFYCTRNPAEVQRADPDEIMRSILKQLSCSKTDLPIRDAVVREYQARKEEAEEDATDPEKLAIADSTKLILAILKDIPATIIIDALDECDPARRHELLAALDTLIQKSENLLKVFVSSRNDNDIVCRLEDSPNVFIQATDNGDDIERFVKSEIQACIKNKRLLGGRVSDELTKQIIEVLVNGAQGMFRWVSLQIQNLCDLERIKHESDVRNEIGKLPRTLKASYDVIFEKIKRSGSTSQAVAEGVIKWLLAVQTSLPTSGFVKAVSSLPDGNLVDVNEFQLLDMCCNLVVIDTELDVFRFAHLSVREYFEARPEYDETGIHTYALEKCVAIFNRGMELDHVFGYYATLYWPIHFQFIDGDELPDRVRNIMDRFLLDNNRTKSALACWIGELENPGLQVSDEYYQIGQLQDCQSLPPNPVFVACAFDLLSLLTYLDKSERLDWTCQNVAGRTPLHVAAANGNEEIVRYLCARGANLESRDRARYTPLHSAAFGGREEVITELLRHGANIEAVDGFNKTPLHVAAYMDNAAAARTLIEHGADLEARDRHDWTPLHFALHATARPLSQLLLDKGANVEAKTSFGSTALHLAITSRASETFYSLLKKGADTAAVTNDGWTSLHLAAASVQPGITKLLLKFGADVNTKTREGKTALELAKDDITRALLEEAEALVGKGPLRWFQNK